MEAVCGKRYLFYKKAVIDTLLFVLPRKIVFLCLDIFLSGIFCLMKSCSVCYGSFDFDGVFLRLQ